MLQGSVNLLNASYSRVLCYCLSMKSLPSPILAITSPHLPSFQTTKFSSTTSTPFYHLLSSFHPPSSKLLLHSFCPLFNLLHPYIAHPPIFHSKTCLTQPNKFAQHLLRIMMQSACHLVARKRDDALRLQIFTPTQEEEGFTGILRKSITFLSCSAH